MSFAQANAIRTVITEVMRGLNGVVRTVPADTFEPGVHVGQVVYRQQIRALDLRYAHRFDVAVRSIGTNEATPLSVKASHRISRMRVEIDITTKLKSACIDTARELVRATIAGDADVAIQALNYPNNLNATVAAVQTGIVSGMLQGPDGTGTPTWEMVEESWADQLLRSRIAGELDVIIQQAVA